MGLTFRDSYNPLVWRNCPSCNCNLVDAEISDELKHTCEPGAFYSRMLGGVNPETNKLEYWKCPDCEQIFLTNPNTPIVHTLSDVFIK